MTVAGQAPRTDPADVTRLFELRSDPVRDLALQADAVAEACHAMAVRFHRGGKLLVFGTGGASTDAQHVAVEFVHPVIVGKRALPAISLTTDVATVTGLAERAGMAAIFSHQLRVLAGPDDIALGIFGDAGSGRWPGTGGGGGGPGIGGGSGDGGSGSGGSGGGGAGQRAGGPGDGQGAGPADGRACGRRRYSGHCPWGQCRWGQCRTGSRGRVAADHVLTVASDDPRVVKEVHVTMYHILWELVHVFLEQPGVLDPRVLP